ncbi:hypothetical protein [Modestobacter roseus]|uniref:DUF4439 domain-containing protein n=1 Tax=Modestobacter roseus TaxID=1181884 RepID=A0A562IS38_9ACTN|nr:hypothetical protein [Modestobacter roseus]MQA35548.1 hypothetical protein [Modestobacter roseus]TWH73849.1 hypothetical protein JD78_02378 [Modestobacter roseus]
MSAAGSPPPRTGAFSRRTLLVAAMVGTASTAVACTGGSGGDPADAVTPQQADQLAAQLTVQQALVDAYDQAFAADPGLATAAATLAEQARTQLDRLQAAAPGATGSPAPTTGGGPGPADARAWLRTQVVAAADAHAAAAATFSGGRAALLGSIAAGLRGQEGLLA